MPTRKKLVKETLPAKQAPVSFYGSSAPRATLIKDKDGKFERNQHVQLANAPLVDWASKANIKQGGGRFDNGPKPPPKPLDAFALLVKQTKTHLLQDANLRATYRDALPAAVVLQEAKTQARKAWKAMSDTKRAALEAQAQENKARYDQEYAAFVKQHPHAAAAVKSPKQRKSTKAASKPPRARGAFAIYAAEQYDALSTKPTGLAGYRSWLTGVRGTWNGLNTTQQAPFVAKSNEEKAAAKQARKALAPKDNKNKSTTTRKGPRRTTTSAAPAAKKRRTTRKPIKKTTNDEEEEEEVGSSDGESEELEFDASSDSESDEELLHMHADSSDDDDDEEEEEQEEEEQEEEEQVVAATKPTNKKTTTQKQKQSRQTTAASPSAKRATTTTRTTSTTKSPPAAAAPQLTSPTGKRRGGQSRHAGARSAAAAAAAGAAVVSSSDAPTGGVSSMAKAAAAVKQGVATTRATGNKRKASNVSKAPATSEYSGAYELPVSPQKKRTQHKRGA